MKDLFDFDVKNKRNVRNFYFVLSFLGIFGNSYDLFIHFSTWHFLINWYNISVILFILIGIALYIRKTVSVKTAFKFSIYPIYLNIIISNLTSIITSTENYIPILRESLFACFIITAAFLFLNERHGLSLGIVFIVYLIVATFLTGDAFLLENIFGIVVLYIAYILILNYFSIYLKKAIRIIDEDRMVIKKQNDELKVINKEINESQLQLSAQNEEVLTLSESINNQNKILEEQNIKLEEALEQKSKLFSIIAHDIKSPLYSIASLTEIILEKYDDLTDERKKNYLTKMLSSNKLLQSLIENLLTWSRSQSGMIEMKPERILLYETVERIIAIYKNFATNKSLQLVLEIDEKLILHADRMMIETILRNLISNAIKYSFEHGIICIKAEKQGMYIRITIQDNGIGISKERINTLFSYSNGIITLGTKGEKGTGLGLRICKEFIEKMNGKIWIESETDQGTTINFILPHQNQVV